MVSIVVRSKFYQGKGRAKRAAAWAPKLAGLKINKLSILIRIHTTEGAPTLNCQREKKKFALRSNKKVY